MDELVLLEALRNPLTRSTYLPESYMYSLLMDLLAPLSSHMARAGVEDGSCLVLGRDLTPFACSGGYLVFTATSFSCDYYASWELKSP